MNEKGCGDLFYRYCDEYKILANNSCNVFTYSVSELQWFSQSLSATYWKYYTYNGAEAGGEDDGGDDFEDDFGAFNAKLQQSSIYNNEDEECRLDSEIPTTYIKSKRMGLVGSTCGYKYQIVNSHEEADFTIKVLREGAVALMASGALALSLTF